VISQTYVLVLSICIFGDGVDGYCKDYPISKYPYKAYCETDRFKYIISEDVLVDDINCFTEEEYLQRRMKKGNK